MEDVTEYDRETESEAPADALPDINATQHSRCLPLRLDTEWSSAPLATTSVPVGKVSARPSLKSIVHTLAQRRW